MLLSFLVIALCSTIALTQQKKSRTVTKQATNNTQKDVLGWQEARWGMTKADIKKIFSKYVSSQTSQSAVINKETRLVCDNLCALIDYKIADELFLVSFKFDDKTKRLSEVSIENSGARRPTQLFDELQKLLTFKYGVFKHSSDGSLGSLVDHSLLWSFPSTIIELKQRYLKRDSTSSYTQIFFKPARLSDANKL